MDRDVFQPIVDYYQNQLLLGFYQKRGKALVIPYVIFALNRLIQNVGTRKIRIIDVGCGKGDLLQIIREICKSMNVLDRVQLFGLDYNRQLLENVKSKNPSVVEVYKRDLRHDLLDDLYGKFDLVISINTLHEVFSLLLGALPKNGNPSYRKSTEKAMTKVNRVLAEMTKLLTDDGSFIFYDGLNVDRRLRNKRVKFKIKNEILDKYFGKLVSEYTSVNLRYSVLDEERHIYEMPYEDFHRFIVTFKFLNTSLWPIESRESYVYASLDDFKKIMWDNKMMIESFVVSNNDVGLWSHNVEILSKDIDFGYKSILLMVSKKFLPSEFDHFCSK